MSPTAAVEEQPCLVSSPLQLLLLQLLTPPQTSNLQSKDNACPLQESNFPTLLKMLEASRDNDKVQKGIPCQLRDDKLALRAGRKAWPSADHHHVYWSPREARFFSLQSEAAHSAQSVLARRLGSVAISTGTLFLWQWYHFCGCCQPRTLLEVSHAYELLPIHTQS